MIGNAYTASCHEEENKRTDETETEADTTGNGEGDEDEDGEEGSTGKNQRR